MESQFIYIHWGVELFISTCRGGGQKAGGDHYRPVCETFCENKQLVKKQRTDRELKTNYGEVKRELIQMRTTNENRNIIIFIIIIIMWLGVGMMLLALDPFVVHVEGIFFFCFSFIGRRTMFLLNKIAQSQAMDDDDEEEEADEKQNRSIFGVIPNTQFTQFSS